MSSVDVCGRHRKEDGTRPSKNRCRLLVAEALKHFLDVRSSGEPLDAGEAVEASVKAHDSAHAVLLHDPQVNCVAGRWPRMMTRARSTAPRSTGKTSSTRPRNASNAGWMASRRSMAT